MKDVLISATEDAVEHKMVGEVQDGEMCYWTVHGTPRQTEAGRRVWFARDGRLFASGEITGVEDGRIWFAPLQSEDRDAPEDPPSRGFQYIERVEA